MSWAPLSSYPSSFGFSLASNNYGCENSLQADEIVGRNNNPMEVEEMVSPHSLEGHEAQDITPP